MAESVHLFLKSNGQQIKGDSTTQSLGRQDSIECLSFASSVTAPLDRRSGLTSTSRHHQPIQFEKRIDRASPLLHKALCDGEQVEGEFRFFRPNPAGDGTTQHYYTVKFRRGRIHAIEQQSPSVIAADTATWPALEQVRLVFLEIDWIWEDGGISFSDTVTRT